MTSVAIALAAAGAGMVTGVASIALALYRDHQKRKASEGQQLSFDVSQRRRTEGLQEIRQKKVQVWD